MSQANEFIDSTSTISAINKITNALCKRSTSVRSRYTGIQTQGKRGVFDRVLFERRTNNLVYHRRVPIYEPSETRSFVIFDLSNNSLFSTVKDVVNIVYALGFAKFSCRDPSRIHFEGMRRLFM